MNYEHTYAAGAGLRYFFNTERKFTAKFICFKCYVGKKQKLDSKPLLLKVLKPIKLIASKLKSLCFKALLSEATLKDA